jgi:hypothetical protein
MPAWWDWELEFSVHAEQRMFERGVSEVEVRAMLQHASRLSASPDGIRYLAHVQHAGDAWVVVLEPDPELQCVVLITVYNVDR